MENNNGGSRLGWILAIILIVVFAAWIAGDIAAQVTMRGG